MFWELIPVGRNPMALAEVQGASRRRKKPITVEQCFAVLELLPEPYGTMVVVAQCVGLRVSEIPALQWPDINFGELTMRVTRGVVDGVVDEVKTEYSEEESSARSRSRYRPADLEGTMPEIGRRLDVPQSGHWPLLPR